MPQVFKIGSYYVYFWSNENVPLEPIHVHVSTGSPTENATKIWLTKSGHCILCHNMSRIPPKTLKGIMRIIETRHSYVVDKWLDTFGEIRFFC